MRVPVFLLLGFIKGNLKRNKGKRVLLGNLGSAVATKTGSTPGYHGSVSQDCSKCTARSLDFLHIS